MKAFVYCCFRILTLPLALGYRFCALWDGGECFYSFSQFVGLFPGKIGNFIRYGFYSQTVSYLGPDACISFGANLVTPKVEIGAGTYIGPHCNVAWAKIGKNVLLGTGVHVTSGLRTHGIEDLERPIKEQPGFPECIHIGEDCWIGNSTVVGAEVGRKSVIGAGSVVTKSVPPYSIAVGSPARVIKDRRSTP